MKKSKVVKITKWEKKPGYNDTSYTIEFENGDKGYYSSKDDDQKRFIAGQEAEYIIEEKQGKNNQKYFKVTSPADEAQKPAWSGGGNKKPQVEPRIQMISFAASYTKDLVVAGKVPLNDFDAQTKKIYATMTSLI